MTRHLLCMSVAGLLVGTPGFANTSRSVPPESFIDYHVSTVNELAREITIDPVVCKRLAQHFHITSTQMVSYARQNLVLRQLGSPGIYSVACVRPNGNEYWVQAHLTAETQVFASRATGQPVLKAACGNPMISALPAVLGKTAFNEKVSPPQLAPASIQEQMAAMPSLALVPDDAVLPDDIVTSDLEVPPVVKVAGSFESFVSAVKPISAVGSGSGFNFLPALAGIGAAVGLLHGSSHSTDTVPPVTLPPVITPGSVPETSTAVSLGLLLLAGGLLARNSRRGVKRSQ